MRTKQKIKSALTELKLITYGSCCRQRDACLLGNERIQASVSHLVYPTLEHVGLSNWL